MISFFLMLSCLFNDKIAVSPDTAGTNSVIYPTSDAVWLFDGFGGCSIGGGGTCEYNQAELVLQNDGWVTSYSSSWYTPSDYRALFLLAPNLIHEDSPTNDEIDDLKAALSLGMRLIITAEDGLCQSQSVETILDQVGASIRFSGESLDHDRIIEVSTLADHQINTNANSYSFVDPCYVEGGTKLFQDAERRVYGGAEQLSGGGEIVLIGDSDFFDDSGYLTTLDNARLIRNLAWIDPDITP
jgi:hypothetical protein